MQKNRYIAAFTIENNHLPTMKVSNLVIGYSRVNAFYEEYAKLPESQRSIMVNDIFTFEDVEDALNDHLDAVSREASLNRHLSPIEDVSIDTSPKVIGRIELPEDSSSDSSDCSCGNCGCTLGKNDISYPREIRDEVYGTWSKIDICEYCYCMEVEKEIFNN